MITLTMTSELFTGQVIFEYNEAGLLKQLIMDAQMSDQQLVWLGKNIPWNTVNIEAFTGLTKKATFTIQDKEVTFEMFWNRYNDKSRSSLKKTQKAWDKLSRQDQVKAYMYFPVYMKNKGAAEKKYATTYLADELWNN